MNRVRLKTWLPIGVISIILLLIRLPSLLEPTWYSDEGTYADIGYALAHGAHLYTDVWDNKPPGVYWLASLFVTRVPPGLGFEVIAFALAATTSLCTWRVGAHLVGARAGMVAGACVAVLISLPNLEGDLFNAEPAGAAATAVAVLLLVRSNKRRRLAIAGSGVALGVAVLFKAVFVVDVAAVAAMVFILRHSRSPGTLWRDYRWLAAGFFGVLGVAALALLRTGSLGAAMGVIFSSDTSYVASADNFGPGSTTWQLAFAALRLLVPLAIAAAVAWRWRRTNSSGACIVIWAAFDIAGVWISARGFFHYIQQAEASLCLLAVFAASAVWHKRLGRAAGVAAILALLPLCEVILWIPRAQTAVADGAALPGVEQAEAFPIEKVPAYYLDGYQSLFSKAAGVRFDDLFPTDLTKQREAVALFRTHTRPGQRVFVWGTIHWAYVLGDRVPAGRYVTLNSAYYLNKDSNQTALLHDIFSHPPAVIIIDAPPPHIVFTFLEEHHYTYIRHAIAGDDYWLAPGEPRVRAMPRIERMQRIS